MLRGDGYTCTGPHVPEEKGETRATFFFNFTINFNFTIHPKFELRLR